MTANHLLLYRLAELMLEKQQHQLPLDILFEDDQIGEFVKSIQIDSPYQQMLLEGVLTETVKEEKLYVTFTVEGYFHFVLGEVIFNQAEGKVPEFLKDIIENNRLNGAQEGVEQCLIRDVENDDLSRLMWLIDEGGELLSLTIHPLMVCFDRCLILDRTGKNKSSLLNDSLLRVIKLLLENPTPHDYRVINDTIWLGRRFHKRLFAESVTACLLSVIKMEGYPSIELTCNCLEFIPSKEEKLKYVELIKGWLKGNTLTDRQMLDVNSRMAKVYQFHSMITEARTCFEECLKLELRQYGELHEFTANSYNELGLLHLKEHNIENAEINFKKALHLRKLILNDDNPDITASVHNLALCQQHSENYEEAISLYEDALDRRLKFEGKLSLNTSLTMSNLGITYVQSEIDIEKGESLLWSSFDINNNLRGKFNDQNTSIRTYLAKLEMDKGNLKEAEYLLKENLEHRKHIFGDVDMHVAFSYSDLSNFYAQCEDFNRALTFALDAIEVYEKSLGESHYYTISSYQDCAIQYENNDNSVLAEKHHKIAIERASEVFGCSSELTLDILFYFGLFLFE